MARPGRKDADTRIGVVLFGLAQYTDELEPAL
jgi:hypothetical protein